MSKKVDPRSALASAFQRRSLIRGGGVLAAAYSFARPFQALAENRRKRRGPSPDYGPLEEVLDGTTGLPLLKLPRGFSYFSFGMTGDPMIDGKPTPGGHDGGAVIPLDDRGNVVYIRNHELAYSANATYQYSFAPPENTYDHGQAPGGTTNVYFNERTGKYQRTEATLSGTIRNCAGGPTNWGSWLTCEETLEDPSSRSSKLQQTHGWVFDVPAAGKAIPSPIKALGRFVHEAAAVTWDGIVYETEDANSSGLYRMLPNDVHDLHAGGVLQMLKIVGHPNLDTGKGIPVGQEFQVEWVNIENPERNVYRQGADQGGAKFVRGEGMWLGGDGFIYFISTSGGATGNGQVWALHPEHNKLFLLFDSPSREVLSNPDNVVVSPRGGLVLCEDGANFGQFMRGLTTDGVIFDFAQNNVIFEKPRHGFQGDFREIEWAGACFTPNGQWLIASIQYPGITFAIRGPWREGAL